MISSGEDVKPTTIGDSDNNHNNLVVEQQQEIEKQEQDKDKDIVVVVERKSSSLEIEQKEEEDQEEEKEKEETLNQQKEDPTKDKKQSKKDAKKMEKEEKERLKKEEKERLERERLEKERLKKEEKERIEKEKEEKERLKKEEKEKIRLEKERLEKEKLEKKSLSKLKKDGSSSPSTSFINIESSPSLNQQPAKSTEENVANADQDSTSSEMIMSDDPEDNTSTSGAASPSISPTTTTPSPTPTSVTPPTPISSPLPVAIEKTDSSKDLSKFSSPSGKRDVVIKVTRAFAPTIHQNVLEEEGDTKMRNKVINEIINTEKDYISDLKVIINVIYTPLKESKIIQEKDITTIFSNIQLLLNVNEVLLADLEKAAKENMGSSIGPCFKYLAEYLKIYSFYCSNQQMSHDHLLLTIKKNPAFKQFLDEKQALPECRQCHLDSFLIKPIQRLCKYPLLLRELIRNSDEKHPDVPSLEEAYAKIQTSVTLVNESKRKAEVLQKMYKIHEQLETTEKFDFLTPTRYLIREDTLRELTEDRLSVAGKMHYFLFNDIIMRTKKDKKSIKLETLFLIASTIVNGTENRNSPFCNTFELQQMGSTGRKFTLVCDTYEQKMEWMTDIEQLIRPHQEESMREYEKMLDEFDPTKGLKRSTIASGNPTTQPESTSPKPLSRSITAHSALNTSSRNLIPSKPLPPPPPKSLQSINESTINNNNNNNNNNDISTSIPVEEYVLPSTTTTIPKQPIITKPKPPSSTFKKITEPTTTTTTTTTTPNQPSLKPPIKPRPLSNQMSSPNLTTPTPTQTSTSTQTQTTLPSTIHKPSASSPNVVGNQQNRGRPLPSPTSIGKLPPRQQPLPQPTSVDSDDEDDDEELKVVPTPSIKFPKSAAMLKPSAPSSSNTKSYSTFTPKSNPMTSPEVPVRAQDDLATRNSPLRPPVLPPVSSNETSSSSTTSRAMPLPPPRSSITFSQAATGLDSTPPKPLPIPRK